MTTKQTIPRFVIYGAGGIGGVIGGHLAMAGRDVVLIGRPDHMNAVRRQGLKLVTPTGPRLLKVDCRDLARRGRLSAGRRRSADHEGAEYGGRDA